jgi:hypothetical protein
MQQQQLLLMMQTLQHLSMSPIGLQQLQQQMRQQMWQDTPQILCWFLHKQRRQQNA